MSLGLPQVLSPEHSCLSTLSLVDVYFLVATGDCCPTIAPTAGALQDTAAQLRGLAFLASSPFVIGCAISSRAHTKVSLMAESELLGEIPARIRLFLIIKYLRRMTSVVTPGFRSFKKSLFPHNTAEASGF